MASSLQHELIGCWVLKGNPEIFDYFGALAAEGTKPGLVRSHNWTVRPGARADLMQPGDLMVLWVTGREDPGIYEVGRLTSTVYDSYGMTPEFVVDEERADAARAAVDFDAVLLDPYLDRAAMKADPVLSTAEQFRIPIVANPTYLDPDQFGALAALLRGRISATAARRVGWPIDE